MSPLSNLPGPWRWERRGEKWWRINDRMRIEDGPHTLDESAAAGDQAFADELLAEVEAHRRRVAAIMQRYGVEVTPPYQAEVTWGSWRLAAKEEYDALSPNQQMLYDEALRSGASHSDAMEAAQTEGYTR